MMKFEYGDFYKFVTSVGIVLIGMAVMIPWLFLREPFDLFITQEILSSFTPLAQSIIEHRQILLSSLVQFLPWFSGTTFFLGIIVLSIGGYMWSSKSQKLIDELNELNKKLLEKKLQEITPAEIEAIRTEEATTELVEDTEIVKEVVKNAIAVEKRIASLFMKCLSSRYNVLPNRRLGSVFFDIVLMAKEQLDYDFVIEVKYIRRGFKYGWIRDNVLKIAYSSLIYQNETNREARSMLFVVGPENVMSKIKTDEYYAKLSGELARLEARAFVIFYDEEKIYRAECDVVESIIEHVHKE